MTTMKRWSPAHARATISHLRGYTFLILITSLILLGVILPL